jgi:hypothetical protein
MNSPNSAAIPATGKRIIMESGADDLVEKA